MKLTLKEKLVYGVLAIIAVATFSIILWEQVREGFFARFESEMTYVAPEPQPTTIDGLLDRQAQEWLTSKEAFDYAREQVTEKVIDELSKL